MIDKTSADTSVIRKRECQLYREIIPHALYGIELDY